MSRYYLSKVELNPRKREARKLLSSSQAMHAAVESSLPPSARTVGERILWRLDRYGQRTDLYVVTPEEPDFTHLVEQAGWQSARDRGWQSRPYGRFLEALEEGQLWAFRLTANPTHSGRASDRSLKTFGHVTVAQQTKWLLERAEKNGFGIMSDPGGQPAVEVIARGELKFRRKGSPGLVTISQATYEGVLRVADPSVLRTVLVHGIGRAKAYGCGLMTLASLPGTSGHDVG